MCGKTRGEGGNSFLLRCILVITLVFNFGVWAFVWKLYDNLNTVEDFMDTWPQTLCTLLAPPKTEVRLADATYRISCEVKYSVLGEALQIESTSYNSYDQRWRSFLDEEYVQKYEAVWAGDKITGCFYDPNDTARVIMEHQSDELSNNQWLFAAMVGLFGGGLGMCCFGCYCFLLRDDMRAGREEGDFEDDENTVPNAPAVAGTTIVDQQPAAARSTLVAEDLHANPIFQSGGSKGSGNKVV
jgi:hypothetical protein